MKRTEIVRIVHAGLMAALFFLTVQPMAARAQAFDESKTRGYDYTGAYGQFGVAIGQVNFDNSNLENDVSGGFTLGGGYRFLPWLAADANFTYLAGEVETDNGRDFDGDFFAFTIGPKIYPLGFFKTEDVPHIFQPYATIGLGGGEVEVEINDDEREEDSFLARFILGFDVWATDHFGLFVEGGGFAASDDDLEGVGIFTVGGQYRF